MKQRISAIDVGIIVIVCTVLGYCFWPQMTDQKASPSIRRQILKQEMTDVLRAGRQLELSISTLSPSRKLVLISSSELEKTSAHFDPASTDTDAQANLRILRKLHDKGIGFGTPFGIESYSIESLKPGAVLFEVRKNGEEGAAGWIDKEGEIYWRK